MAVLFVEKKDLDEQHALKAERETRQKEKAKEGIGIKQKVTHNELNMQHKWWALADGTSTVNREDMEPVQGEANEVEVLKEDWWWHYARQDRPAPIFQGKVKEVVGWKSEVPWMIL